MKRIILTLSIVACALVARSQSSPLSLVAGPALSIVDDGPAKFFGKIGYYAGIKTDVDLVNWFGVGGTFIFMDQFYTVDEITLRSNSVNGSFYARLIPTEKLSLNAGFQLGIVSSTKVEGDKVKGLAKDKTSYLWGASYALSEKLSIDLTYLYPINDQLFDGSVLLGVGFKLK